MSFALILDAFNHCVKLSFYPPLSEDFHGFPTSEDDILLGYFTLAVTQENLKKGLSLVLIIEMR